MGRRVQAGMIWLNTYKAIAYSTPFGGYKDSGIGRLNGFAAVDEFLQTKTIWHEPERP
jgi:aldehyde dehydrogenase (NAD+)